MQPIFVGNTQIIERPIEVRFIDIDGTILQKAHYAIGDSAVYPESPTRDHLEFIGWTHTLEELSNLQNRESERGLTIPGHIDVGALYKTSDDKTHIFFTARQAYSMTLGVYFSKIGTENAVMNIDWGDGSAIQTFTITTALRTKVYAQPGNYHVQVWSNDNVTYGLGNGAVNSQVCTTGSLTVERIYFSDHVVLKNFSCSTFRGLTEVSLPSPGLNASLYNNMFGDCSILPTLIVPKYTAIPNNFVQNCIGLETLVLPQSIQTLGTTAFKLTPRIERLVLPKGIHELSDFLFDLGSASHLISDTITSLGQNGMNSWYLSHTINLARVVECSGNFTLSNAYSLDLDGLELFFTSQPTSTAIQRIHLVKGNIILRGIDGIALASLSNLNSCTSLTIGANFTSISAAITSPNIMKYRFESETPPTMSNAAFLNNTNFNRLAVILVPDSAVDTYKTATNWTAMAGYVKAVSEDIP